MKQKQCKKCKHKIDNRGRPPTTGECTFCRRNMFLKKKGLNSNEVQT